jgi:aspartyl-tRNA synthetase
MIKRAAFVTAVRNVLAEHRFVDVETPILTKSTPEGARDYLVPSRVHAGKFYALPQSPQIFKQLLMVAGLDRYYQIARCFRDEDLRADRQPEFTQIDLEMSFIDEEDVFALVEDVMVRSFREAFGVEVARDFPRITWADAMQRYGVDKPDLRFGMEIQDVGPAVAGSDFKVFAGALGSGGSVKGLRVEGAAESFSRKDIDGLTAYVGEYGAKGLAWLKVGEGRALQGPIAKFFEGEKGTALCDAMGAGAGDLLLFVADRTPVVHRALGELRVHLGTRLGLRTPGEYRFCWVTDFPMFEYDEDAGRWQSLHHPFTAPHDWNADLQNDPGSVRSRAYDLVLNGWELGSGSIRIHRRDVQAKVFDFLGIDEQQQQARFGFLLEAFRYGAPPHGGIALGVDRVIALALGRESLRDVIAFPKTTSATDLMCQAPDTVDDVQLDDLHIAVVRREEEAGDGENG